MKPRTTPRARAACLALAGALALAPTADGAEPGKSESQAVTPSGPTLKYEQFRRKVEIRVAEKREEQISGLLRLLKLGPAEAEVPDIKFRLAELYYEKSRFFFFRSQEADDRISRAKSASEKAEATDEKTRNARESQVWTEQALEIYREIRERFPAYPRMPEVLFALGQSYWNDGRYDDAIEAYGDLIQNFKDSPLVADAWLAFGEYYFNEAQLQKALKSYELAATDKRSRVYGFALYKQAWCYYNLADWEKAINKFRATIFYSQMASELSGENKISLAREAQKDFVRTYAHVGNASKARFELGDITGDEDCKGTECWKLLEQLASIWAEQGKFDDSASLFRQLIKLNANNTRNPFFQAKIVDLTARSADRPAVIREARRLVEVHQETKDLVEKGTFTGEAKEKAAADLEEATALAESTIRRLAQTWNREAKKTRQPKTYEDALAMYEDYLRLFPGSQFTYELRFELADLYYKLERFDDAAKAYEATVLADPKGKYLVEAANDNILAVEEHLKDLRLKRPKVEDGQKAEIHPERLRLVGACDRYVKFVPAEKADKLVSVMFKAGKVFYDHNHFDESITRFQAIVEGFPDAEQAEFAANLIVDIYNLRKDWKSLYATTAAYLKNERLVKDREKLVTDLRKFSEYAKFSMIQILEEGLKKADETMEPVAEAYEEFQQEFPESENADKALFNASVVWDSVGEKERADGLRARLMADYKDSPLRADVQFYIARSFEERAEFEKAAELFLAFSEQYAADPRARDALFNAAVFYAGVGKVQKANELRELYLKKFGKQKGGEKEAAAIYYSMAVDLERAEKRSLAAQRYEEFVKKFAGDDNTFEALWRERELRRALGQRTRAEKIEGIILGTYNSLKKKGKALPPKAADYASRIAFLRFDENFADYDRVRVERPNLQKPKEFQRSLDEKARARDKLIKGYTAIVTEYQQAHSTIAALHRIAECWDEFVSTLLAVPCPRGLNDDQCLFFKQGLEEKIEPARASSIAAYQTCVGKSNELNVFTADSIRCVKALEKVAPESYPQIVEKTVPYSPKAAAVERLSNLPLTKLTKVKKARPRAAMAEDR